MMSYYYSIALNVYRQELTDVKVGRHFIIVVKMGFHLIGIVINHVDSELCSMLISSPRGPGLLPKQDIKIGLCCFYSM